MFKTLVCVVESNRLYLIKLGWLFKETDRRWNQKTPEIWMLLYDCTFIIRCYFHMYCFVSELSVLASNGKDIIFLRCLVRAFIIFFASSRRRFWTYWNLPKKWLSWPKQRCQTILEIWWSEHYIWGNYGCPII